MSRPVAGPLSRVRAGRGLVGAALVASVLLAGCAVPRTSPPMPDSTNASTIVAFGDSYTEGHGASEAEAYPARLAQEIQRPVLNKGITGETAGEALSRFDRDVVQNHPSLVIVEFGVNEAYRGYPVARSLHDIETITTRIQNETRARVILVGVHFWTFQRDFDDGLRDIAARHKTGLVLDVLHGIVSSRRDADDGDASLRSDAFHPNARGYALMAERIRPAVEDALAAENGR